MFGARTTKTPDYSNKVDAVVTGILIGLVGSYLTFIK